MTLLVVILFLSSLYSFNIQAFDDGLDLESGPRHTCKGVNEKGVPNPKSECLACIRGYLIQNVQISGGGQGTSKAAIIDEFLSENTPCAASSTEAFERAMASFWEWRKNHTKDYPY